MGLHDDTPAGRILDELGSLIRALTRITGGPDEGPPMSTTQRLALFETSRQGPLRLHELAGRLGISESATSRAVDGLVELGLLERRPDPDDRRAVQIDVTRTGRARFEERHARVTEAFAPAVADLSRAEQEQLAELLARLASRLRA